MGVGLLMALRCAEVSVGEHAVTYWPYMLTLLIGLMLIISCRNCRSPSRAAPASCIRVAPGPSPKFLL
jgi:hypothetical protein